MNETELRELMCEVGRRIWQRGLCAGNEGNHSVRLGDDKLLCTPSGVSKGFLKPDDLAVCDMQGNQISGKRRRTSEVGLHLSIYHARPDVRAVVHSHPPHATAFAIAGVDLPLGVHPEAEVFLGPVPTAAYVTPGDARLGESILPHVAEASVILLASHGVVCFDAELEQAYYRLEIIDAYAKVLLLSKQLGPPRTFDFHETGELLDLKARFGQLDPRMTFVQREAAERARAERRQTTKT